MVDLVMMFDVLNIGIWAYALYLVLQVADEAYGSALTSAIPSLVGSVLLFLLFGLMLPLSNLLPFSQYIFSIQIVQIVAGILLISTFKDFYSLTFATRGFIMEEDE